MSEHVIDAVDAYIAKQPFPKDADVSMISQQEVSADLLSIVQATIPTVPEGYNPFDEVSPMSQHPEELDAKMQPENVPPEDQAASE